MRPRRCRRILGRPHCHFFKPAGVRMVELNEVTLAKDEFEAIRLVDFEETGQGEAGKQMKISQPTLSRLLKIGRKKVADAIVSGKAIRIEKKDKFINS